METTTTIVYRYLGQTKDGTHSTGTTDEELTAFVKRKYDAGWRWLIVEHPDGYELAGIYRHDVSDRRLWWSE